MIVNKKRLGGSDVLDLFASRLGSGSRGAVLTCAGFGTALGAIKGLFFTNCFLLSSDITPDFSTHVGHFAVPGLVSRGDGAVPKNGS